MVKQLLFLSNESNICSQHTERLSHSNQTQGRRERRRGKGEGKKRVGKGELGGEKKTGVQAKRREKDMGKRRKRGESYGDFKEIIECNTDVHLSG